ncbi:ribonuclease P protein component [Marinobacter orientalis]|uniref:Ribonuclease P protein component n=1 Tax=Marinobacter orientalis TaxID=1928859 RepID=A0A7Y0NJZ9_9GAMM|nr:ribonuclease P protein component [Marinobacter orientalis]NMT62752.1 ribonuclease P protein component [Marinobacter orientalis]TGX51433.1 ribonuclease P protein component [Marinobacter orientalis]
MKALTFPKSSRLLKPADYGQVFDDVQIRVPHRNFLILATPNTLGHARIGLVFSKKNLRLAVQRNRVKRRVRETFRHQTEFPALDIVVLGRRGLSELDNATLNATLTELWSRLRRKNRQLQKSSTSEHSGTGKGTG